MAEGITAQREVVRPQADGTPDQLKEFRERVGRRKGMRFRSSDYGLAIEVDADRIEDLGPLLEAVSMANKVQLKLSDLGALVMPSGRYRRPSPVWSAIADAALRRALANERGAEPDVRLFEFVRVVEPESPGLAGERIAVDDRPPLVEPTDLSAQWQDAFSAKFDDADWHVASAVDAGYPEDYGWTHIALYLTWLIRRDLVNPESFHRDALVVVKAGAVTDHDIMQAIDNKLVAEALTEPGASFTSARYEAYVDAYSEEFGGEPEYSIPCDVDSYARMEPSIDRLWAEWTSERKEHG